ETSEAPTRDCSQLRAQPSSKNNRAGTDLLRQPDHPLPSPLPPAAEGVVPPRLWRRIQAQHTTTRKSQADAEARGRAGAAEAAVGFSRDARQRTVRVTRPRPGTRLAMSYQCSNKKAAVTSAAACRCPAWVRPLRLSGAKSWS